MRRVAGRLMSVVVIWELSGTGEQRQRRGLRLIGYAFAALAVYLLVQSTVVLAAGYRPQHSVPGIVWTAVTAVAMSALAAGKASTGRALGNPIRTLVLAARSLKEHGGELVLVHPRPSVARVLSLTGGPDAHDTAGR